MKTLSRQEIFAKAAKKLRQDFRELSETVPHNAVKGQEAVKLVKEFLAGHLPKRFDVGAGFIIDQNNSRSKQSDVIIYDAYNCPVYRVSDDAAIFPNDNVAAVVEVKSRLDKKRLLEAFENIAAVKSLAKSETPKWAEPRRSKVATRIQTVGCVFAFKSSLTMETLRSHYIEEVQSRGLGPHIDLILVLDRGILTLVIKPPGNDWGPVILDTLPWRKHYEDLEFGAGIEEMGENSLDAFLRHLLLALMNFRPVVPHPGFDWDPPHLGYGTTKIIGRFKRRTHPPRRAKRQKKSVPRG
jgi:Domain of unknown function (DUF6602)